MNTDCHMKGSLTVCQIRQCCQTSPQKTYPTHTYTQKGTRIAMKYVLYLVCSGITAWLSSSPPIPASEKEMAETGLSSSSCCSSAEGGI